MVWISTLSEELKTSVMEGQTRFGLDSRNYETRSPAKYKPMTLQQCVVNEGEQDQLICTGYRVLQSRQFLYYLLCTLSLGIVHLVCYWKPEWKIGIQATKSDMSIASHVILQDKFKRQHVKRIQQHKFLQSSSTQTLQEIDLDAEEKVHTQKKPSDGQAKQAFVIQDLEADKHSCKRYFEYKLQKYIWRTDTFLPLRGLDFGSTTRNLREMAFGLNTESAEYRRILFGNNSITVPITPLLVVLFREVINPFYAFQIFSIIVWCIEVYFLLAAIIGLFSIVSISLSLYMTRKENVLIHKMSAGSGQVRVLRESKFQSCDSSTLVPGDVIELQECRGTMWCDGVILSGTCVVDESMLTGESVPLIKTPLSANDDNEREMYDMTTSRQHTLYGGTKVLDVHRSMDGQLPRVLVLNTGFYTEKGKMIESMLAPAPVDYKYYSDSLRFVLFMAILGVIGGIIAIIVLARLGATASHIITRILDLITIVVPPGLPAGITIATLFAHRRLKKSKIYCISPPRINISGKINCMCFDKTGTLTEDGLKLLGVVPADNTSNGEGCKFYEDVHAGMKLSDIGSRGIECQEAMACCHSLVLLDGKVSGDPVDMELFQAVDWVLRKPTEKWSREASVVVSPSLFQANAESLGILRIFQFNSVLKRMSVIAKREASSQRMIFVKGAPEIVASLCLKNTVPDNFAEELQKYTRQGYRVLALANKNFPEKILDVETISRDSVECDLQFLGLVVLMNPLKPETRETITNLRTANIRTIMSTGDNIETAIFAARKCGMIPSSEKIVTVEAKKVEGTENIHVTWSLNQNCDEVGTIAMNKDKTSYSVESGYRSGYHLALTGTTFSLLCNYSPKLFKRVLASATVYARMKPDNKKQLVEELQKINYVVGMCGDGANDCGALKSAHAGVVLAEAENSIMAHFTAMDKNISCCHKLIREGRAALVTSFGMIKYLCLYSFIQYLSLIILYTINSYLSDIQFLFADIGVTGIVFLFFALGGASKTLWKTPPQKSLVKPIMLACLWMQIILIVTFQAVPYAILKGQSWHTPLVTNMTHPKENIRTEENTVVFYTSCFQDITLAFIFYNGLPHRKPIYRNVVYFVLLLLLTCWAFVMVFAAVPPISDWFTLTPLDYNLGFKFLLILLYVIYFLCAVFVEKWLLHSDWFKRKLDSLVYKFLSKTGLRKEHRLGSEDSSQISFQTLKREISMDPNWPPTNTTTVSNN